MKRLALVTFISLLGITSCKSSKEPPAASTPQVTKPATPATSDAAAGSAAVASDDPWQKPEATKDPLKNPFFWAVERDGKTTYMLGTMHLGVDAEARLPKLVWDKLDAATTFAMEADVNSASAAKIAQRKVGKLRDDIGPAYWKKLEEALGPAVANALDNQKPMVAALMLSLKHLPPTPPMDGVLHGRAMNQKKQIVFLESIDEQAAILEKHMDARSLKMMLDNLDKGEAQTKQMLASYLAGDPDAILTLMKQQKDDAVAYGYKPAEYDAQMEDLLYKRNANWIAPLEKILAQGNGFVAVGTMHLIGPRSVLELLEKKGYKITRVTQ